MKKVVRALSALALVLSASAALAAPPQKAQDRVPPGIVDGATARALVADGVKVVDVRTPDEFASGHVPGAVNIPYDQISARAAELGPASTPVLLYCRSGRRSGIAAQALGAKGFTRIYDMQAYDRWVASEPKGK
jgi:rhodanese-related sulfurtransferase